MRETGMTHAADVGMCAGMWRRRFACGDMSSLRLVGNQAMFSSEVVHESTALAPGHDDRAGLWGCRRYRHSSTSFRCLISLDLEPITVVFGGRAVVVPSGLD
ncbi:hypothetical protein A5724_13375 [Mycobacterium sp. ACS1612]|nr:hypothetical protein A5724_13375 [Mycobacterium sp. ACS1612]